jgi:hypothetical protein
VPTTPMAHSRLPSRARPRSSPLPRRSRPSGMDQSSRSGLIRRSGCSEVAGCKQAIRLDLDHRHSSATLMISLPRWSPVNNLISVSGKVSSPSTMCSRDLSRPLARQAASARVASSSRAA